jgi:acetyltransferase
LALAITPAPVVAAALREGLTHGLRAATIYAAGFGEGGDAAGQARAAELRALAAEGLRICGPNCMGTLSLREGLLLYPNARVRDVRPGNVALAMQSGGLFQYWLQQAAARGLGFSYAASIGNELDLDLADYLEFFVADERTSLICCFAEGIGRPAAFAAAAEAARKARKPIILVKSGRSDLAKEAVQSHTGSLAGDDRVFDAVCERYGIVRCASLDDMIENALAFRSGRLPAAGGGVIMIGYSGAARGLLLDAADDVALSFAQLTPATKVALEPLLDPGAQLEVPIDLGATIAPQHEKYAEICRLVVADPNCALLAVQAQLPVGTERQDPRWLRGLAASTGKPVFAYARVRQSIGDAGREFQAATTIDSVQGIPETVRAAKALMRYAAHARGRLRLGPTIVSPEGGALKTSLRAHGVTLPREGLAATPEAAVALAEDIGVPVAVKLHAPVALHKTEIGGVRLGLRDAGEIAAATRELLATAAEHPELGCDGVLVQAMADGLEMIVGARVDAQFGPIILVGLGGVYAEVFDDVALRLLPIDADDARAMLGALRGRRLFDAFRGRPPRDVDALVRAICGVGELFLARAATLTDLEINPLVVLAAGEGVLAVDVRIVEEGP